jgi:uncharacterized protein (DUF302 family)
MTSPVSKMLTVRSNSSYDTICSFLPSAVQKMKYGVLHSYNLTQILQSKGQTEFKKQVSVFEVCNPAQAVSVLNHNLSLSNLLPCRIVVYNQADSAQTIIETVKPTSLIQLFDSSTSLQETAAQVESDLQEIINITAKGSFPAQ